MTIFGFIFFLLFAVGFLVWFVYSQHDDMGWAWSIIWGLVISVFGSLVLIAVFIGLGGICAKYEKDNVFGVTYISSLSANSTLSGDFCLGSGHIENKDYYYFVSTSELGSQISKVEVDGNTYIKEDGSKKPFIEFTKYKAIQVNWFGNLFYKKRVFERDGEVVIHVPKKTVVKTYNVDIRKL